jgi:hypothetical protein
MSTTKASVRTSVVTALDVSALAIPTTNASKHHAMTSPNAALVRARTPSLVFCRRRSTRMRASTGKAVTDIATPTKRTNTWSGARSGANDPKSAIATNAPRAKGTAMLAAETASDSRVARRTADASSSRPTRNMNKTTPTWATTPSGDKTSAGNSSLHAVGATRPRSEGPSKIPASISPTTRG